MQPDPSFAGGPLPAAAPAHSRADIYRQNAIVVPPTRPRPAPPHPFRPHEIGAALGLAVIADVALFDTRLAPGGFGLALLFGATPLVLAFAARRRVLSPRLVVIAGLLALVAVRSLVDPTPSAFLAGTALVFALTLTLRARRTGALDVLVGTLRAALAFPYRLAAWAKGAHQLSKKTLFGRIALAPVLVPAGLVMLFGGIFALANPVVAHDARVVLDALGRFVTLPSPGRIVFFATMLTGATLLVRPVIRRSRARMASPTDGEASPASILVARNALVGLNALFLAYNALDSAYLWFRASPRGLATQAYAHEGAFWLTVALLCLTVVVSVFFRGPLAHDGRGRLARGLAYGWIAQGLVLAVGTYRRIFAHIVQSGLSDLRIVAILGTSLVVVGVVLVAKKLRDGRSFAWLLRRQLDALALTAAIYAVSPTHLLSAKVNVARITHGEYRPVLHMFRQSKQVESATALLPLLDHPDPRVRQGVAALLEQETSTLQTEAASRSSWRERDLATKRTLARLDAAAPQIAGVLGTVNRQGARRSLLEISRVANEDRSLEEILAVPAGDAWRNDERAY